MAKFKEDTYVICVGRSFASGGLMFAHALSKALNIPLYDKNILDQAAEDNNIRKELFEKADERATFSVPVVYGGTYPTVPSVFVPADNYLSNENLFILQSETIEQLAEKGSAIFVGRSADFILREHPNRLSLFITEDEGLRIQRIKKRLSIETDKEAHKEMEKMDKQRREYYNFFTSRRWGRAENYDLTLKLSYFGMDYAVKIVVDLLHKKGFPLNGHPK